MKTLYTEKKLHITLQRLAKQLVERHGDFSDSVLIGIQPRGVFLADRMYELVNKMVPNSNIDYGKLDITFYRDDYNSSGALHIPTETNISFEIGNKRVILVDDVLFTGRTIRAAMDALLDFGRPKVVELLVLIDRRFSRELPIQPDYFGLNVDVIDSQKVKVLWQEIDGKDEVIMI